MMAKKRELLFSVTKKDLRIDTFRAGGPGGQNQNKRDTGVRITHPESGAVGTAREHRTQEQNRRAAFRRMIETPKFKAWHRMYSASLVYTDAMVKRTVEAQMQPQNIRIEYRVDGKWVSDEPR
jgi:protein subunit release factor B